MRPYISKLFVSRIQKISLQTAAKWHLSTTCGPRFERERSGHAWRARAPSSTMHPPDMDAYVVEGASSPPPFASEPAGLHPGAVAADRPPDTPGGPSSVSASQPPSWNSRCGRFRRIDGSQPLWFLSRHGARCRLCTKTVLLRGTLAAVLIVAIVLAFAVFKVQDHISGWLDWCEGRAATRSSICSESQPDVDHERPRLSLYRFP